MGYTRANVSKILRDHGIDDAEIKACVNELMDAHTDVTDALKDERDQYKADAEANAKYKTELDELKKDDWQKKYADEHDAFEKFKADTTANTTRSAKESAYRDLLSKSGISEKYLAQILKVTNLDTVELDGNGGIKDADKLTESIKTEWSGFVANTQTSGAKVSTPPANSGAKMTREQIMAIPDRTERRAAIAANPEAFSVSKTE